MGNLVVLQHKSCVNAYKNHDINMARRIIDDKLVNDKEIMINEEALKSLAFLNHLAKDLRVKLSVVKIVNELEMIGDYVK